jgi:hypothetical protein
VDVCAFFFEYEHTRTGGLKAFFIGLPSVAQIDLVGKMPKKAKTRSKEGYQRDDGRWEARYRPQCRWEVRIVHRTCVIFSPR